MTKNIMNKSNSVPKLNLAPKLKRPLSLSNPLDYLHLLYWIFFFPQAINWYIDRFGGKNIVHNSPNINSQDSREVRQKITIFPNLIQFRLLIQGLLLQGLIIEISIIIVLGWEQIFKFSINNFWIFLIFTYGINYVVRGVATGIVFYTSWITIMIIMFIIGIKASVLVMPMMLLTQISSKRYVIPNINHCFREGLIYSLIFILIFNYKSQEIGEINLFNNIISYLFFAPFSLILVLRPDCWLFSFLSNFRVNNRHWFFAHTTFLPLPFLCTQVKKELQLNWDNGIHNANQILQYSLQIIPVVSGVNQVLAKTSPEQIIYRVNSLTKITNNWQLIYFVSASLRQELVLSSITFFDWFVKNKQSLQDVWITTPRINTPARATAAGFWYLHEKQPSKATEAFQEVRSLLYGEEVYTLASTLAAFQSATELNQIAQLDLPAFPQNNLLRADTWQVLNSLHQVVDDIKLIQNSVFQTTKALALNRAIGEFITILDTSHTIPEVERELIIEITHNWKQRLEKIAKNIGNIAVTKPVVNPYVIGDPVQGSLFAGREDIMRQLQGLWLNANHLQSAVLYGHRRMGKTSILLNLQNYINADIKIAYINLLCLGDCSQGVGEVLMQICDGIADATDIAPPDDHELIENPYHIFRRYIKKVGQTSSFSGLIIAIDEFEKIEELINTQRIPTDFLSFLRGIVQMNPKIALIFAGLHTLEEMTADYFQPFFASVIPLHVDFMNCPATRQILANPVSQARSETDFVLDYTPEAVNLIYYLTAGQPYLVQLMGFQLVRHYNQQMFEQGIVRQPLFTKDDVEAIVEDEFFQLGRYYFEGVWQQAAQDATGQQEIIKALAPYPQGLSEQDLLAKTNLNPDVYDNAIAVLKRHDVIIKTETGWRIIVKLFRRWVNRSTSIF
jgi:hypothetical protein